MRVHFHSPVQYEMLLKKVVKLLREKASELKCERFPLQRPRNAMCKAFGYRNYDDMVRNNEEDGQPYFHALPYKEQVLIVAKSIMNGIGETTGENTISKKLSGDDLVEFANQASMVLVKERLQAYTAKGYKDHCDDWRTDSTDLRE